MTSPKAFTGMTCRELKIELNKRDLPTSGLKKDLLHRLNEAENATLIDVVSTVNDSGRSDASFEVQPTVRSFKSAWKLLCLTVLCVSLFLIWWCRILGGISVPGAGNQRDALTPQDLSWLNFPEHYKVLDLPADAPSEDIKRAYRQKAKKWHPDKAATLNINQEVLYKATRIIGLSRDILLDSRNRQLYDMGLNPEKCDSSCELCTCNCGKRAESNSRDRSDCHSISERNVVMEAATNGAFFVLKMTFYGVIYSYRLPECWLWHWDLPLWDKKYCTANPLDDMWSEARSIRERCQLECDDKVYACGKIWDKNVRNECESACKRDYRAKSR